MSDSAENTPQMLRAEARLSTEDAQALADTALPELRLPYLERSKSRLRAQLDDGREIGIFLARGSSLREGDVLVCDNTQLVRVRAAAEDVMLLRAPDAFTLLRAAYHLGNRHMPIELGIDCLKLEFDAVLADMVRGLGLTVTRVQAPFEPESGAYAQGIPHHHHH